jgi:hypothetical protein
MTYSRWRESRSVAEVAVGNKDRLYTAAATTGWPSLFTRFLVDCRQTGTNGVIGSPRDHFRIAVPRWRSQVGPAIRTSGGRTSIASTWDGTSPVMVKYDPRNCKSDRLQALLRSRACSSCREDRRGSGVAPAACVREPLAMLCSPLDS